MKRASNINQNNKRFGPPFHAESFLSPQSTYSRMQVKLDGSQIISTLIAKSGKCSLAIHVNEIMVFFYHNL